MDCYTHEAELLTMEFPVLSNAIGRAERDPASWIGRTDSQMTVVEYRGPQDRMRRKLLMAAGASTSPKPLIVVTKKATGNSPEEKYVVKPQRI